MKSAFVYLSNLLTAILRTIFISVVLFFITYCIITREFPPNFAKLKKSWAQVQRLTEISKTVLRPEVGLDPAIDSERDVEKLSQIAKARAEVFTGESEDLNAVRAENRRLQESIKSLEREVMFANQRILGLKDRMDAIEKRVR